MSRTAVLPDLSTDAFDYLLPPERIAAHPVRPRDAARMLVICAEGPFADRGVRDLPALLNPGDALVVNNTKVLPTRFRARRTGREVAGPGVDVELTLHRQTAPAAWRAFARPAKRLKVGDRVRLADDFFATVAAKHDGGEVDLAFDLSGPALIAAIAALGAMPLPPYIRRDAPDPHDRADYQTIFAKHEGAVAAPTAGLHFSDALLAAIKARGVTIHEVTLHVGAGTFLPVKATRARDHKMHAEWGCIDAATAAALHETRARGGRIVAVGTTVVRLLESAAAPTREIAPFEGETDLFILPGYRFKAVDAMLTNFHLPRSTLLMLVAAFAGRRRVFAAYEHAIENGYRFYSYGDCCFMECAEAASE